MQTAIPVVMMRGGTSKGLYFHRHDLPADRRLRDRVLLAAMGSPDARQIDGLGGAHPLTSKVAIISSSETSGIDVDYQFLQVAVERADVSDNQNCGNILAGVGPFAIESGLVKAADGETEVSICMLNSGAVAIARVQTPGRQVSYAGNARIDGVPGTAMPVMLDFQDLAGSNCGSLLPTGNSNDEIDGICVTCIDNGMPVVVMRASDFSKSGYESPLELESDTAMAARIEAIRLQAGRMMKLGDVSNKTVPKMILLAAPLNGGVISTRSFIPHRVHTAIGVLAATSVATACLLPGSLAHEIADLKHSGSGGQALQVEHPTGTFEVEMDVSIAAGEITVHRTALLRTARKLMQGSVFVPSSMMGET